MKRPLCLFQLQGPHEKTKSFTSVSVRRLPTAVFPDVDLYFRSKHGFDLPQSTGSTQDQPKVIITARDSINYRLTNSIHQALRKINKNQKAENQIRLITSTLPKLPDTPFIDLRQENKKWLGPNGLPSLKPS